jgi:hypothetical protein
MALRFKPQSMNDHQGMFPGCLIFKIWKHSLVNKLYGPDDHRLLVGKTEV